MENPRKDEVVHPLEDPIGFACVPVEVSPTHNFWLALYTAMCNSHWGGKKIRWVISGCLNVRIWWDLGGTESKNATDVNLVNSGSYHFQIAI